MQEEAHHRPTTPKARTEIGPPEPKSSQGFPLGPWMPARALTAAAAQTSAQDPPVQALTGAAALMSAAALISLQAQTAAAALT